MPFFAVSGSGIQFARMNAWMRFKGGSYWACFRASNRPSRITQSESSRSSAALNFGFSSFHRTSCGISMACLHPGQRWRRTLFNPNPSSAYLMKAASKLLRTALRSSSVIRGVISENSLPHNLGILGGIQFIRHSAAWRQRTSGWRARHGCSRGEPRPTCAR